MKQTHGIETIMVGYTSLNVVNNYTKSDGSKCGSIDNILTYIQSRPYRSSLSLNGTSICTQNVIDVIAIGIDRNQLRSGSYDPVIMSLDFNTLASLNLKADTIDPSSDSRYFSTNKLISVNPNKALALPGVQIKFSDLTKCNTYASLNRNTAYAGASSDTTNLSKQSVVDYWNQEEMERANYVKHADTFDSLGITELSFLFYTHKVIDELQSRFGYKVPNNANPYSWMNWLVASTYGTSGANAPSARYYKLLYLTEFDLYAHAGMVAQPSKWLDAKICASPEFNLMVGQIVNPANTITFQDSASLNYLGVTNALAQGQQLPAGQYIYSKDYKYKLHLSHAGVLRVYEFPINGNSLDTCKYLVMGAGTFAVASNAIIPCYLAIQVDGNIVIYTNPTLDANKVLKSSTPAIASDTANNAYFGMDSYKVIVSYGGTVVAVNGGLKNKIGADQVAYISHSNDANWMRTDDPNNAQCIHGWKFVRPDGTGFADLNQIINLSKLNDTKNWCYTNPFIQYTDSDGKIYKFAATNMQQILWMSGKNDGSTDNIYNFLTSGFIDLAKSKGWAGNISISSADGILTTTNYCMRGKRWISDPTCKDFALKAPTSIIPDSLKRLIDYDIKARACSAPSTDAEKLFCSYVNPDAIKASLISINSAFAYIPAIGGDAVYANSASQYDESIRTAIVNNMAKLSEDQLLYVRYYMNTDKLITAWKNAYALAAKVSIFTPTTISFNPYDMPLGVFIYKNYLGSTVIDKVSIDTNLLRSNGTSLVSGAYKFATTDKIWKYFRVNVNHMLSDKGMPFPYNDMLTAITNDPVLGQTQIPYTIEQWQIINTDASTGDIWVFRITNNADVAAFLRRNNKYLTNGLFDFNNSAIRSSCSNNVDLCYPEYSKVVMDPNAELNSSTFNFICDAASPTTANINNPRYFSADHATQIKKSCNNTYGIQTCTIPKYRYKATFKNNPTDRFQSKRKVIKGTSNYNSKIELFSGAGCTNLCNDPSISQTMADACRTGSVAYCKDSDNIYSDNCQTDIAKYSELADIQSKWCSNNPTHPNYANHCNSSSAANPVNATTTSANTSANSANATTTMADTSTNPVNSTSITMTTTADTSTNSASVITTSADTSANSVNATTTSADTSANPASATSTTPTASDILADTSTTPATSADTTTNTVNVIDQGNHFPWWTIILICIAMLFIGLGVFIWKRKRSALIKHPATSYTPIVPVVESIRPVMPAESTIPIQPIAPVASTTPIQPIAPVASTTPIQPVAPIVESTIPIQPVAPIVAPIQLPISTSSLPK